MMHFGSATVGGASGKEETGEVYEKSDRQHIYEVKSRGFYEYGNNYKCDTEC